MADALVDWEALLPGPDAWPELLPAEDASVLGVTLLRRLRRLFEEGLPDPPARRALTALADLVWERLNAGHWAAVAHAWRRAYAVLRLVEARADLQRLSNVSGGGVGRKATEMDPPRRLDALLKCLDVLDDGLTMGAPLLDNRLALVASAVHHAAVALTPGHTFDAIGAAETAAAAADRPWTHLDALGGPHLAEVPRLSAPSLETFQRHVSAGRPLLLTGCLGHWEALGPGGWSVEGLARRAGYRTVPVEFGKTYADAAWSQRQLRLLDYVRDHVLAGPSSRPNSAEAEGRPVGYLAQHQLFVQVPDLLDEVPPPDYCYCLPEGRVDANVWLGPRGTVSPLHHDPRPNLLAQVRGAKYVQLFSAEQSARVYPHPGSLLGNTSRVDVERPDLARFPEFTEARGLHCVLQPGEMLFIPPRHWHYVRSLSVSVSVNFWFD